MVLFSVSGVKQSSHEGIQQFVGAVNGSRLGSYIEKLSKMERIELGQRYLADFVILSFKIMTKDEVRVSDQYKSPYSWYQAIEHVVKLKKLKKI